MYRRDEVTQRYPVPGLPTLEREGALILARSIVCEPAMSSVKIGLDTAAAEEPLLAVARSPLEVREETGRLLEDLLVILVPGFLQVLDGLFEDSFSDFFARSVVALS